MVNKSFTMAVGDPASFLPSLAVMTSLTFVQERVPMDEQEVVGGYAAQLIGYLQTVGTAEDATSAVHATLAAANVLVHVRPLTLIVEDLTFGVRTAYMRHRRPGFSEDEFYAGAAEVVRKLNLPEVIQQLVREPLKRRYQAYITLRGDMLCTGQIDPRTGAWLFWQIMRSSAMENLLGMSDEEILTILNGRCPADILSAIRAGRPRA